MTVLWGVTSYDRGGNAGFVVHCLFTTRAAAERYVHDGDDGRDLTGWAAGPYEIEEFELYEEAPSPYTYWHRGASVYPDGTFDEWKQEHTAQPPGKMPAMDDHLNSQDKPWDGHTQNHCGEHLSIFGTDEVAVEEAFQRHLTVIRARATGTCPSCGRREVYQSGWMGETRLSVLVLP